MERILIIDDDEELCELVAEYLKPEGFALEIVHNGQHGIERARQDEFALLVLDVMLPGANGFEVLRQVRAHSRVPVLMLTARGDDVDRIVGLELGADDYLPKPFNPRELVARIRAILRRTKPEPGPAQQATADERLSMGDVELDKGARVVRRAGELVELTSVEFDLLEALLRAAGRVVTREELVTQVLGRHFSPFDRSVDMHVSNLRKKLGHRIGEVERIRSVRGVGYVYVKSH
jgi:two-component system, OmpR family, response regulator CpxR